MAKLERGVHTRGLRFNLTLQSEDVETHSAVGDNQDEFNRVLSDIGDYASTRIRLAVLKEKKR